MRAFQGATRTAFYWFFLSHILITLLIDGQAVLPSLYPEALRNLLRWYCLHLGDVLMRGEPHYEPWFVSIVVCEVLLQLPFFVIALRVIATATANQSSYYPEWFRRACLVYGGHVATTLVPILGTFLTSNEMTTLQKIMTISVYSPYLIFPLLLVHHAARDSDDPSSSPPKSLHNHSKNNHIKAL
jgi:hypothetical protein